MSIKFFFPFKSSLKYLDLPLTSSLDINNIYNFYFYFVQRFYLYIPKSQLNGQLKREIYFNGQTVREDNIVFICYVQFSKIVEDRKSVDWLIMESKENLEQNLCLYKVSGLYCEIYLL